MEDKILKEIKNDLSDNYNSSDEDVLKSLLEDAIFNALYFSNRKNTESNIQLLKSEIKEYVKTVYLQRGTEDVKSLSESGKSSTFKNPTEQMRNDIVKNGKRLVL